MAEIYLEEYRFNGMIANMRGVKAEVKSAAQKVEVKAEMNLKSARASTTHVRIDPARAHETEIKLEHAPDRASDWLVSMYGVNPMALEYGHYPSGYFDPDRYGSVTKAPGGLYILNRAAGFPVQASVTSDRWKRTKKRNPKRNKKR